MTMEHSWTLEKYAQYVGDGSAQEGWQVLNCTDTELRLTLTKTNHLLITSGSTIQENFSLWAADKNTRGIIKGDSLLIVHKVGANSRRFRVKFVESAGKSSVGNCQSAVAVLAKLFCIKSLNSKGAAPNDCANSELHGQVPLSALTKVLSGGANEELPRAYRQSNMDEKSLKTMIRLCLSDSTFPVFVGKVEREMAEILNASEPK